MIVNRIGIIFFGISAPGLLKIPELYFLLAPFNQKMSKKSDIIPEKSFTATLLRWHREKNTRQMPWKGEKDPYKIWLSEIILQQTRVEQGLAYYERFISAFPDVRKLAAAPDRRIFKLWEGLGYYSRCRNLIHTARYIASDLKGKFPDQYDAIRQLKGVGPYTAAAISSFGFGLPYAVVDGNVYRVLARVFGISTATDTTEGKRKFGELAQRLIDPKHAGAYNQAIMDFGAVICKPVSPACSHCIFKKNCIALKTNAVSTLPVKSKKLTIKKRWFYYLVLHYKGKTAIQQRKEKDIWRDLYEFPLIEHTKQLETDAVILEARRLKWLPASGKNEVHVRTHFSQLLTHQRINGQFIEVTLLRKPAAQAGWQWIPSARLRNFAFPKSLKTYLESSSTQL